MERRIGEIEIRIRERKYKNVVEILGLAKI